jgi:hypothetical protein
MGLELAGVTLICGLALDAWVKVYRDGVLEFPARG